MSDYLNNLQPSFISYEALEVACHALESYCDRLRDSEAEKLKVTQRTLLIIFFYLNIIFSQRSIAIGLHWKLY